MQEIYETIEAYLNGTLTGDALTEFEQRLKSEPDLAAQVQLFQNMDDALNDQPALDFQKIVQMEGAAFLQKAAAPPAKVRRIGWSRKQWAIAATLLFLVVSAALFWKMQSTDISSGDELFAQHFETYTLNEGLRGEEDENVDFKKGIQQYRLKNYGLAAETFNTLAENAPQDMVLAFCLANAYLNQSPPQTDLAQQQFQKIIADGSSIYTPTAKWYMALTLLKKERWKRWRRC